MLVLWYATLMQQPVCASCSPDLRSATVSQAGNLGCLRYLRSAHRTCEWFVLRASTARELPWLFGTTKSRHIIDLVGSFRADLYRFVRHEKRMYLLCVRANEFSLRI